MPGDWTPLSDKVFLPLFVHKKKTSLGCAFQCELDIAENCGDFDFTPLRKGPGLKLDRGSAIGPAEPGGALDLDRVEAGDQAAVGEVDRNTGDEQPFDQGAQAAEIACGGVEI